MNTQKEDISEPKYRMGGVVESEQQKENRVKKNEQSLKDLCDIIKRIIHIVGISGEIERDRENILKNNGRELPKFDEKHKYNQETQQLLGKKNSKKSILRHIIIKLSKDKDRAAKMAE